MHRRLAARRERGPLEVQWAANESTTRSAGPTVPVEHNENRRSSVTTTEARHALETHARPTAESDFDFGRPRREKSYYHLCRIHTGLLRV